MSTGPGEPLTPVQEAVARHLILTEDIGRAFDEFTARERQRGTFDIGSLELADSVRAWRRHHVDMVRRHSQAIRVLDEVFLALGLSPET